MTAGGVNARELLAAATPRPWHVDEYEDWCAVGADGRLAAYCGPQPPDPQPVRASRDAALIVEAVNEYDALLDVEEQTRQAIDAWNRNVSVDADFLCIEKHLARLDGIRGQQ